MAIQINTTQTTPEGFNVTPFVFLNLMMISTSYQRANLIYYKDQSSFEQGNAPLNFPNLPSSIDIKLTSQEFWGNNLMELIHQRVITELEPVVGQCTIVTL